MEMKDRCWGNRLSGWAFALLFVAVSSASAKDEKKEKPEKPVKDVLRAYSLKKKVKTADLLSTTPGPRTYKTSKATNEIEFMVYVPANYAKDKPAPLVYTLSPGGYGYSQEIEPWKEPAEKYGWIIVSPQSALFKKIGTEQFQITPETSVIFQNGLKTDEAATEEILNRVFGSFSIDPEKTLVTAWFSGGIPFWYAGWRHPEAFTAIALRGASYLPFWVAPIESSEKIAKIWRKRPIYVFWGQKDRPGIAENSSNLKDKTGDGPATLKFLKDDAKIETVKTNVVPGDASRGFPDVAAKWWAEEVLQSKAAETPAKETKPGQTEKPGK